MSINDLNFRVHDAAESPLVQVEDLDSPYMFQFRIELSPENVFRLIPTQPLSVDKPHPVSIEVSISVEAGIGNIYEREFRFDRRSGSSRGLEIREGSRYIRPSLSTDRTDPIGNVFFDLFKLLGIDLEVIR